MDRESAEAIDRPELGLRMTQGEPRQIVPVAAAPKAAAAPPPAPAAEPPLPQAAPLAETPPPLKSLVANAVGAEDAAAFDPSAKPSEATATEAEIPSNLVPPDKFEAGELGAEVARPTEGVAEPETEGADEQRDLTVEEWTELLQSGKTEEDLAAEAAAIVEAAAHRRRDRKGRHFQRRRRPAHGDRCRKRDAASRAHVVPRATHRRGTKGLRRSSRHPTE